MCQSTYSLKFKRFPLASIFVKNADSTVFSSFSFLCDAWKIVERFERFFPDAQIQVIITSREEPKLWFFAMRKSFFFFPFDKYLAF